MKALTNQNARTLDEAVAFAQEALRAGQSVSFAAGGTDLLQLMKDRVVNRPGSGQPDVLVNLKTVDGLDQVTSLGQEGVTVGRADHARRTQRTSHHPRPVHGARRDR